MNYEELLPCCIFIIEDTFWNIKAKGRKNHRGFCMVVSKEKSKAALLLGCDAKSNVFKREFILHYVVNPSKTNRLAKPTAVILEPYISDLETVIDRYENTAMPKPKLDAEDCKAIKSRFLKWHPDPWETDVP